MNRAKFRAFDKRTNKMIATGYHVIGEVTMFRMIENYLDENRLGLTLLERLNDVVEMQFAGTKDSKGTDIYLDDLVKAPSGHIFNVIWHEKELRVALLHKDLIYNLNAGLHEVVGNIHQHAHLLK